MQGETVYRPRLDAWDKRSDLVLWEDLEGAGGEGGGRGDRDGEDLWTQGLFISMYDKIHYKLKKNKNTSTQIEGYSFLFIHHHSFHEFLWGAYDLQWRYHNKHGH